MSNFKKRQQSLKNPDVLQAKLFTLLNWCRRHPQAVLKVAAPIMLLFAISIIGLFWQGHVYEQRRDELSSIDILFQSEELKANEQRQAISDKLRTLADVKGDTKETDKAAARLELEEKLKKIEPDHTKSIASYTDFFAKHQKHSEGWKAAMQVAQIQLKNHNYAAAQILLEELLEHSQSEDFYQTQGRILLIATLEDLGLFDKAIKQAEILVERADEDGLARALFTKGRVQLLAGETSAAIATLDLVINEHNSSAEAQKAKALKAVF